MPTSPPRRRGQSQRPPCTNSSTDGARRGRPSLTRGSGPRRCRRVGADRLCSVVITLGFPIHVEEDIACGFVHAGNGGQSLDLVLRLKRGHNLTFVKPARSVFQPGPGEPLGVTRVQVDLDSNSAHDSLLVQIGLFIRRSTKSDANASTLGTASKFLAPTKW